MPRRPITAPTPAKSRRHRSGDLPGRWLALLGAAALAACLIPASATADDTTSPVVLAATVYSASGSVTQESVTLAELQADPTDCPPYPEDEMAENQNSGSTVTADLPPEDGPEEGTWGLASALACMSPAVPLSAVQAVIVQQLNGTAETGAASELSPADLAVPSDFANPNEVPVLSDAGTAMEYNRPARSASDDDYDDQVVEPTGSPIAVDVYEGQSLAVSIVGPPQTTVPAGTALSFSADVQGPTAGLTYGWDFGGGAADSSSAAPTVSFATAGVYAVQLEVTDASGGVGNAQPLAITVTAAARPTQTQTQPRATVTTPAGRGTPGSSGTRSTGAQSTSTRSTVTHPGTATTRHAGGVTPHPASTTAPLRTAASTTTSSSTPPITPSPAGGGGGGGGGGVNHAGTRPSGSSTARTPGRADSAASPLARPPTTARTRPRAAHHPPPPTTPTAAAVRSTPRDRGRRVSGRLIAVTAVPVGLSPLASSASPTAGQTVTIRPASGSSAPALIAALAGGSLLLVLGAARELSGAGGGRFRTGRLHSGTP